MADDLKDVIATNVIRLRHAKGWTQEELADRVGLSARYLGQVERGQASMSVTVLGAPRRHLGNSRE
jgi:transcriptional regulator with XRE-family HTH domain